MNAIVFGVSQEAGDERPDFAGPQDQHGMHR
jgi:hypothetical protein